MLLQDKGAKSAARIFLLVLRSAHALAWARLEA
jgi:hypothetical protein